MIYYFHSAIEFPILQSGGKKPEQFMPGKYVRGIHLMKINQRELP